MLWLRIAWDRRINAMPGTALRNLDFIEHPKGKIMKPVLTAALFVFASLAGLNPAAVAEESSLNSPTIVAPIPDIKSMHVPKKYSKSEAIAKAMAKYPGYKLTEVRELQNVWVVLLKK